jgi:SET domain-containing protein
MTEQRSAALSKGEKSSVVMVKKSRVQGRGVFARRAIAKGERIIEYVGERISHDEANDRYDDEEGSRHHTFLFTVDERVVIDAAERGNEARFINHSCDPNCEAVISKRRVFIDAIRDIEPGEELFYDYWYSTDAAYSDEDLRRIYPCRCGAAKCRGTIAAPRKAPRKKKRAARN